LLENDQHRSAERELFDECGVVCLRGLLQAPDLALILEEIQGYVETIVPTLEERMMTYEPAASGKLIRSLFWMNARSEFFRSLPYDARLRGAIASLVDWEPIPHYVEYFAKPPQIGAALRVHQDAPSIFLDPPDSVVLWIALDAANEGNGGVHFYPGSHTLGVLPHNYADDWYLTIENTGLFEGWDPVCFDLAPGDASVHTATTVHFSTPNRSAAARRGLGIAYRSGAAALDEKGVLEHVGFEWPR
jgi:phytanoyl-CoA hydroxylase